MWAFNSVGFPDASMVKNPLANTRDKEDPLEKEMATPSSIFAWRILTDGGVCRATVHGVAKELDTT